MKFLAIDENNLAGKGFESRIYEELIQLSSQKPNIWVKNAQMGCTVFPEKTNEWAIGPWKHAQDHKSTGKCKSQLQRGITLHPTEWLLSKDER